MHDMIIPESTATSKLVQPQGNQRYKEYDGQQATGEVSASEPSKAIKILLCGTGHGHICIYHERQASVEAVPAAFLRLVDSGEDHSLTKKVHIRNAPPSDPKASLVDVVPRLIHKDGVSDAEKHTGDDMSPTKMIYKRCPRKGSVAAVTTSATGDGVATGNKSPVKTHFQAKEQGKSAPRL
jgi:hypothetical protein